MDSFQWQYNINFQEITLILMWYWIVSHDLSWLCSEIFYGVWKFLCESISSKESEWILSRSMTAMILHISAESFLTDLWDLNSSEMTEFEFVLTKNLNLKFSLDFYFQNLSHLSADLHFMSSFMTKFPRK